MQSGESSALGADSDDDFDWEEVDVPQITQVSTPLAPYSVDAGPSTLMKGNIEITIHTRKKEDDALKYVQLSVHHSLTDA